VAQVLEESIMLCGWRIVVLISLEHKNGGVVVLLNPGRPLQYYA